jgi:hypothetical protein
MVASAISDVRYCTVHEHQLKFATYARRMIAAARLEPPQGDIGQQGSGASNLPPGPLHCVNRSRRVAFRWAATMPI